MKAVFLFLIFALAETSSAQDVTAWSLPAPDTMIAASNTLCRDQASSVLQIWEYKKNGRTKEDVEKLIPPAPKAMGLRFVSALHENVEDAYRFPQLSVYAYYSFRSEVCMRETLGAVRMPRLETIYPRVAECQKTHGTEQNNALFKCIQSVVRLIEPS
ncbi:hypothetical protein ACO0LO_17080 [Undibacterium sp. TJN25]|uniref:hypothetical protein n=1 Tax=Undibacterium sp. TJN25 TaxID=3413056 RepID=UPI003BF10880